ncbi:hypothetical protein CLF_108188 [Clonorchis sinensis]|uniref:C2H2-type domain-containing protein n=1 Tax=Clonorchis sinensis TaxID=79923 RepID=G7YHS3_CLOSI|nr:hypothetical protein CLF_108188 [Clonorchis sinensis]
MYRSSRAKSFKRPKNVDNTVITKADKGKATVVMNKSDYLQKVKQHLAEGPYRQTDNANITSIMDRSKGEVGRYLRSVINHLGQDCMTHKFGGKLKTTVYENPADTGAVLKYSSAHPKSIFTSIASLMFRRVRALCTEEFNRTAARIQIKNKLRGSRNPAGLIRRQLRRVLVPVAKPKREWLGTAVISYKRHRRSFEGTRDCVYKIKCNDCIKVYIGQTARELHTRIGEHKRKINRPPRNADEYRALLKDSAIAEHTLDTGHKIDLENVEVLGRGMRSTSQRLMAEAVEIAKHPSVNRIEGVELARVWRTVLHQSS